MTLQWDRLAAKRRRISWILGMVVLALVLTACSGGGSPATGGTTDGTGETGAGQGQSEATGEDAGPKVLRVAIGADLSKLDPHFGSGSQTDSLITANVFDGLLMRNPETMELGPYVAESWEVSPDGKVYTFHLRRGVKFHSGDELTAEDVKWSFERTVNYEGSSLAAQFRGIVDTVEVVDPYTIRFVLNEPAPTLLAKFETQTGYLRIASKAYYDEVGEEAFQANPGNSGSGPYMLKEWVEGQRIVLEANPNYMGGKPAYDQIIFLPIPDEATRVSAVLAGDVDIAGPLSPNQVATIEGSQVADIKTVETTRRIFLGLNAEKPPFDNKLVRQAASHAIDVDAIIANLLQGQASRIYSNILPFEFGYSADVTKYPYDPEKARELLAQAGYGDTKVPITINSPQGRYVKDLEAAQAIAQYLNDAGFEATVQQLEWSVYLEKTSNHDQSEMYLVGYGGGGSFDADTTMSGLYLSSHERAYFKSPELDEMILRGRSAATDEERKAAYAEALTFITENAIHIPLWNQHDIWAVSKDVDWTPLPNESLFMFFAKPR